MIARVTAAACLLTALSGCAFTTEDIQLHYAPQVGVSPIDGASRVVVAVDVKDARHDKTKVSVKKNGYGMEMAAIRATEPVTLTVRQALETELRARGFSLGSDATVTISGEISRFYNDHKMGFFAGDSIADFDMFVVVTASSGELRYSRQITAQGIEPNIQLTTGNNARLALDQALANGMAVLFADPKFLAALVSTTPP